MKAFTTYHLLLTILYNIKTPKEIAGKVAFLIEGVHIYLAS